MDFKKILVPVDFTPCAINALKYAVNLAKTAKAKLMLVHSYDIPVTYGEVMASSVVSELTVGVEEGIKKQFKDLTKLVPQLEDVTYETLVKPGFLADTVLSVCESEPIGMAVIGTKGTHGISEFLIGTNTYAIVKDMTCPVIVIPESSVSKEIKKIAFASDYKKTAKATLLPLEWLAKSFGAELHILHVCDEKVIAKNEAEEAKKLELLFKDVHHHYHLIVNKNVEEGLDYYIKANEIDLLALVPRKHNFFDRIMGTSESRKIIFHAQLPLMTLPDECG